MTVKFINKEKRWQTFLVSALFILLFVASCDNEDDPEPGVQPTATFTFSANELEVTFSNTSTDGLSFSWDFGDGNTSSTASPVHTYEEGGTYNVKLTAVNGDLSDETTSSVTVALNPENVRLKSGYIVIGTNDEGSTFARYFDEMPTGTIDITQGATAFQSFFPLAVRDGSMYLYRTDNSNGFEKLGVNGNGEFVEDGIFSTNAGGLNLGVCDSEYGIFSERSDPNVVFSFNPSTMTVTGSIDMTLASEADSIADEVGFQDFLFRGNNEIWTMARRTTAGDIISGVPLLSIDATSNINSGIAIFEGLENAVPIIQSRRLVDENGNIYVPHFGNTSIPTVSGAVLKIPAGATDYDPNYNFEIPVVNNPATTGFGSFMVSFEYFKDNRGFAVINESIPQAIIDLITERGGTQNLLPDDIALIQQILFTDPTGAWVEVDMVSQSVSKVAGVPAMSVFDRPNISFVDGTMVLAISTATENAAYKYLDDGSGSAEKLFDATGARLIRVLDLSENFQ